MDSEANQTKVITVTLSPSLDRTMQTHYLALGYQNRISEATRIDPSGPAVNIARAVHCLATPAHAIIALGNDAAGIAYEALIRKEGFDVTIIPVEGQTRSRVIIYDTGTHAETQIVEEGREVSRADLERIADALRQVINPGDYVVFAGRLPVGEPLDTYGWLTDIAQAAGARVAVMAGGAPLAETLSAQPNLVALTAVEAEAMFNHPVRQLGDVLASGHRLREMGAQRVLIAMKGEGRALLISGSGVWEVALPIGEGTTSGVWEALVAGYLAGRIQEHPLDSALSLGAAAATYAADQVGVEFGTPEDIDQLTPHVDVTQVAEPPRLSLSGDPS